MIKKIVKTIIGIIIIYSSVAVAMKAGIGVLPVDAAIATIADVIEMKVGTFSMLFHGSFFVGQIVIEKKQFRKTELLQILYIVLGGTVLNFILYVILKDLTFTFYPIRLIVCVLAFIVSAFGCTMVLETRLMRTPMEGCIQLIAERIGSKMGSLRQKIDIGLVLLSVILTYIFGTDWTLREGTIVAALIFGPTMDFWKKYVFKDKKQSV
jgi:uncharacterized membrane protein YczE